MKLLLTLQIVILYLMLKKIAFYIIIAATAMGFVACNEESDEPTTVSANVMVTSFTLNANDSVLDNLDSVFFTIDLVNAKVFNADSLPYGTDVSHLVVNIGTYGSSVAELSIPRPGQSDSIVNYLKNSTDSIDFSNGPVKLHLVALDGTSQRDYTISVNVHKVKPDSLFWNKFSLNRLPTNYTPIAQKTVKYNDKAVCLTKSAQQYTLATINNPANFYWTQHDVTFPFTPNVNSLNATTDALYILDTDGNLYSSVDGMSWTSCGLKWHHIYGGYGNMLLGVKVIDGKYYHVTYPETSATLADSDCPISGTSSITTFETKWSDNQQVFFIGGRKADNELTGAMWGYDGEKWAKVSNNDIAAREDMTFFAYYTFKTNENDWSVSEYPTLVALGGFDGEGYPGKRVYTSIDMGLTWKIGDDLMQLPSYIPEMGGAQALVFEKTMQSRSASTDWVDYPSKPLPSWWTIDTPTYSRVSQEPNKWECPYIYLFGGYDRNGDLYNTIWRGVINRLTFKPVV